ncbi:MAG: hypothetical protein M3R37_03955 [Actinomycetota bacterium]|nr:hypothetical protein [Actinomycetota bacterium]
MRDALELWRDEPLADLRDEPFAQRASRQLDEARLAVHQDRLEADLAHGRHAELVPELEGLIVRDRAFPRGRSGGRPEFARQARPRHRQGLGRHPSRATAGRSRRGRRLRLGLQQRRRNRNAGGCEDRPHGDVRGTEAVARPSCRR